MTTFDLDKEFGQPTDDDEANDAPEIHDGTQLIPIDWRVFWSQEHDDEEWILEPVLALGRGHSLTGPAKAGKSLLALEWAVAIATGRACLHKPAGEPRDVVYADLEMSEADLRERLEGLGCDNDTDLSHLHYFLLPLLKPLNTPQGGREFVDLCIQHGAEFVVIDTLSRVVEGEENSNDTFNAFYAYCGMLLKQAGIGYVRLDHLGKQGDTARGGSSKQGDVDLLWTLVPVEGGIQLKATPGHRVHWAPTVVDLKRTGENEGQLRHILTGGGMYPAGTADIAALLDANNIPADLSSRKAGAALREAGHSAGDKVIRAAQRYRQTLDRQELEAPGAPPSPPTPTSGVPAPPTRTTGPSPTPTSGAIEPF